MLRSMGPPSLPGFQQGVFGVADDISLNSGL